MLHGQLCSPYIVSVKQKNDTKHGVFKKSVLKKVPCKYLLVKCFPFNLTRTR